MLIANRGEIAVRVVRACRDLGMVPLAVYSTADRDAMHVRLSDEAICIGGPRTSESYLDIRAIVTAARLLNADAVHPGVGFLSENASFARKVEEAGLIFIGARPEDIATMGDKVAARKAVSEMGVPVLPGSSGALSSAQEARELVERIGYPVILKAAAGGGGRGMALVSEASELESRLLSCQQEAEAAFGDGSVFVERFLSHARHVEVQIFGDGQGGAVHMMERDCSVQRSNQKLIEESPAANLPLSLLDELCDQAVRIARAIKYRGAGTVEFLVQDGGYYFIEMNVRLQVEHPVSELISGRDLMEMQINVARGHPLPSDLLERCASGEGRVPYGWAIEARINAEDPVTMAPAPGKVLEYVPPGGPGVRVDSYLYPGAQVPPWYDNLLVKIIVHAEDRDRAIARLRRALGELVITGVKTNTETLLRVIDHPEFQRSEHHVRWFGQRFQSGS